MKINTILIDDSANDLEHLKSLCKKINSIKIIKTFSDPLVAHHWLCNNNVDLIITDIEMPNIDGVDLIKSLIRTTPVIFVSSHLKYALKSYDVAPLHYLIKPIKLTELMEAINRINKPESTKADGKFIYIQQNNEHLKIEVNTILYAKAEGNFIQINTTTKTHLVLTNLTQFTKQLPVNCFIRVHKSYLVNSNKIDKYTFEHLIISEKLIPIGVFYREDFQNEIKKYSIKRNA